MNRRLFNVLALAAGGLSATRLSAQTPTKIVFGYTAVTDFTTIFVAREEGYFSKRGLDVEPKFIPINSTIPAAIQSDSLQMGGPTPSVYLQAVDGGLDHVVVAGGGTTSKSSVGFGLVARAGSGIRTAQDCVGRKIGVPGIGAFLHVTFREWLRVNGVDYKKVVFIEAPFPQHGDLMRAGSVDAVVTADPFMTRITETATAYVASYYGTFLADGNPTIIHTAKREWVQKNPTAPKAFRDALVEAAGFMAKPANDEKVRAHIGKYIKLPPETLAKMQISPPGPVVSEKQLNFWVKMMKDQDMLKTAIQTTQLIVK
jgi:NitT/TauT family transport system substrate-binding protein